MTTVTFISDVHLKFNEHIKNLKILKSVCLFL